MRCGDQPEVALDRTHRADPFEPPLLQDPEQFCLNAERELPHLVQKQGAAVGSLEAARAGFVGTGKGPALVTKQLGVLEGLRDRRAVDGDVRSTRASTVLVDGTGDQLLAGAALPANHNADVAPCDSIDSTEDLRHLWGTTDDTGVGKLLVATLLTRPLIFGIRERAADRLEEPVPIKRLGHVVEGPRSHGADHGGCRRVTGQHDHRHVGVTPTQHVKRRGAAEPRKTYIHADHIGCHLVQTLDEGLAVCARGRLHACAIEPGF